MGRYFKPFLRCTTKYYTLFTILNNCGITVQDEIEEEEEEKDDKGALTRIGGDHSNGFVCTYIPPEGRDEQ